MSDRSKCTICRELLPCPNGCNAHTAWNIASLRNTTALGGVEEHLNHAMPDQIYLSSTTGLYRCVLGDIPTRLWVTRAGFATLYRVQGQSGTRFQVKRVLVDITVAVLEYSLTHIDVGMSSHILHSKTSLGYISDIQENTRHRSL